MRRRGLLLGAALAASLSAASPVTADDASARRGRTLAQARCARCHAIGPRGASPMRAAPSFRSLAGRFPVDDLADILVEGVERRHPAMPDFRLDPGEAADLTSYLKVLGR